jgi:DNA recombination-dependent growth factor C
MSFDIAVTPTLQAVATPDEELLAHTLQARVREAIASAEQLPEVVEAVEAQHSAEDRLARLRKAERSLSHHTKETREQTAIATAAAMDAIIESAELGARPDFKKLHALSAIENHSRYANRAIERIVEHLIPTAEIVSLRAEAFALMTRARGIEAAAQDRAERVLGQMRDAVTQEMVLPVDMSKGVAGALLAHAAGLRRCAVQISENADRLERSYGDRLRLAGAR